MRQTNSSPCLAKTLVPYPDSFHHDLSFPSSPRPLVKAFATTGLSSPRNITRRSSSVRYTGHDMSNGFSLRHFCSWIFLFSLGSQALISLLPLSPTLSWSSPVSLHRSVEEMDRSGDGTPL